jgi:hypothetical protein
MFKHSKPLSLFCVLFAVVFGGCVDLSITTVNTAPDATITSHSEGEQEIVGAIVLLRGSVSDTGSTAAELVASFWADDNVLCQEITPADDGSVQCEAQFDAPGEVRIGLEVRDRHNATGSDAVHIEIVTTDPPALLIVSPQGDDLFLLTDAIFFRVEVGDPDTAVEDLVITWESNIDGMLSDLPGGADPSGGAEGTRTLSEGEHTLTVTVSDPTGASDEADVSFEVTAIIDADGDGYPEEDDCDDNNPTTYPWAGDTLGDGVDSDCDGLDCEAGWYGTATYYAYCPVNQSWVAGNTMCSGAGYDGLASVLDDDANTFLGGLADAGSSWIGLSDSATEGSWVWVDGSSLTYANWGSGEPNGATDSEDCLEFIGPNHINYLLWNDAPCELSRMTMCSKRF